jgi:hypothetical protein
MAAVRSGTRREPGKAFRLFNLRPPTDVMAITSLPFKSCNFLRSLLL